MRAAPNLRDPPNAALLQSAHDHVRCGLYLCIPGGRQLLVKQHLRLASFVSTLGIPEAATPADWPSHAFYVSNTTYVSTTANLKEVLSTRRCGLVDISRVLSYYNTTDVTTTT